MASVPPLQPIASDKMQLVSSMLITQAPLESFLQHYNETLANWIELVKITTLPIDIHSSSDFVKNAFDAVGRAMAGPGIFARLAHVRLLKLFDLLEVLIQSERKRGLRSRSRNSTIAITRLIEFQEARTLSRVRIRELRRLARRWEHLAGPSVFLLLMYSEAAEPIMYAVPRVYLFPWDYEKLIMYIEKTIQKPAIPL